MEKTRYCKCAPKIFSHYKFFFDQNFFLLPEGPLGPPYGGASPSARLGSACGAP